ncbi:MAG: FRG domain-containing protein [Sulfitobacter geojensis]
MSGNPPNSLSGQWIGTSNGDPQALMIIDLDRVRGRLSGHAYLFPDDENIPSTYARIDTEDTVAPFVIEANTIHFLSDRGYQPTINELRDFYPDVTFPKLVTAEFLPKSAEKIELSWKTDAETYGQATLHRTVSGEISKVLSNPDVTSWDDFQKYVTDKPNLGLIFRGQSAPWPLRTSFHRTNRRDLIRYLQDDIPRLHHALSPRTKHFFNLSNPIENGAFLNLAQHHGFPTPLLDWSRSPFVAAYFAYSEAKDHEFVRIYAFDQQMYEKHEVKKSHLNLLAPHFSILEAISIENDRATPQQGLLSLTNLEDIEGFVLIRENCANQKYLHAFDLPRHEASKALSDLRLMGITRATMFPSIESTCLELRRLHFD